MTTEKSVHLKDVYVTDWPRFNRMLNTLLLVVNPVVWAGFFSGKAQESDSVQAGYRFAHKVASSIRPPLISGLKEKSSKTEE